MQWWVQASKPEPPKQDKQKTRQRYIYKKLINKFKLICLKQGDNLKLTKKEVVNPHLQESTTK